MIWSLRNAAAVLAATVLLAGCGGAEPDEVASVPPQAPAVSPDASEDGSANDRLADLDNIDWRLLDRTVDEVATRWNDAVTALDGGYAFPSDLGPLEELGSMGSARLDFGEGGTLIVWLDRETRRVQEMTLIGPVDDERVAIAFTNTAGAMVYAASDRTLDDAVTFLTEDLMAVAADAEPNGFVTDLIEEPGYQWRFSISGSTADWFVGAE